MLQPNNNVHFIDISDFKYITGIDENVDASLLVSPIQLAMDIRIQQVLGNSLYVKMKNEFVDQTMSQDYETLLNSYIKPAVAWWALYYALPAMNFRLTNKAISQKRSDSSDPVDINTVDVLRRDAMNHAEFYTQSIRDVLNNNRSTFTDYFVEATDEGLKPSRSAYSGSIHINKRYRGGGCSGR